MAGPRGDLGGSVLREIRQTEDDYRMASFICGIFKKKFKKVKLIETERKKVVVRGGPPVWEAGRGWPRGTHFHYLRI